jgi:hypothetical protein
MSPIFVCLKSFMVANQWLAYILRRKVSKWVTNGSKTAIIDVIGFICVSLSSSTVQLHDNLGSRWACACSETGFSSQHGDHAWGVYYRRTSFCCAFLWAKGLNAKDIYKECKAAHSWVANVSMMTKSLKRRCGSVWDNSQKTSVLRVSTHCRSDRSNISMLVEYMSRNKCFSQVRISHILRFISICDLLTDSPSYLRNLVCVCMLISVLC